jgi:hypothetical protein
LGKQGLPPEAQEGVDNFVKLVALFIHRNWGGAPVPM